MIQVILVRKFEIRHFLSFKWWILTWLHIFDLVFGKAYFSLKILIFKTCSTNVKEILISMRNGLTIGYPSLPHTPDLNTSLQHKRHSFSAPKIRHLNIKSSLVLKWGICVEMTNSEQLCGSAVGLTGVSKWGIFHIEISNLERYEKIPTLKKSKLLRNQYYSVFIYIFSVSY